MQVPQTPLHTSRVLKEEKDLWEDVKVKTLNRFCPDPPLFQQAQLVQPALQVPHLGGHKHHAWQGWEGAFGNWSQVTGPSPASCTLLPLLTPPPE